MVSCQLHPSFSPVEELRESDRGLFSSSWADHSNTERSEPQRGTVRRIRRRTLEATLVRDKLLSRGSIAHSLQLVDSLVAARALSHTRHVDVGGLRCRVAKFVRYQTFLLSVCVCRWASSEESRPWGL